MIRIVDYKAGNATSVMRAVRHLGFGARYAKEPLDLADASHIILPGVGSAQATMDSLREQHLIDALEEKVLNEGVLFCGICVGLQVLFETSEEGHTSCLGWLPGRVKRFDDAQVRVPQMGWNQVRFQKGKTFDTKDDYFYFVNSYYAQPDDADDVWATADYGVPFCAAVQKNNIYATQFHLEKSGSAGLGLLQSFLCQTGKEVPGCLPKD